MSPRSNCYVLRPAPPQFAKLTYSGIFCTWRASYSRETEPKCNKPHTSGRKFPRPSFLRTGFTLFPAISKRRRACEGDSLYNDFSYDHRFLHYRQVAISALAFEYERYDFLAALIIGLPDHLQSTDFGN